MAALSLQNSSTLYLIERLLFRNVLWDVVFGALTRAHLRAPPRAQVTLA